MFSSTDEFGRWQPGIGDPTIVGWLTVLFYFAAAWLCMRALRTVVGSAAGGTIADIRGRVATYWLCLAFLLVLLGINKQLDLQSWFTQTARDMAIAQGWYQERQQYQVYFIQAVVVAAVVVTSLAFIWLRQQLWNLAVGLIGVSLLLGFIVIRAASFHNVDALISGEIIGFRLNTIMELGALALIAQSARGQRKRLIASRPMHRNRYSREQTQVRRRDGRSD